MKVLAVIVTYYPDLELLKRNIEAMVGHVDHILLWENTPSPDNIRYRLPDMDKLEYYGVGENVGISRALNLARGRLPREGYDAILTMDQDSVWENLGLFMEKVSSPEAPFGLYGPAVYTPALEADFTPSDTLITSGMLVPKEVFERIGGYEEMFFVDGIDLDFCYRAAKAGIHSWIVGGTSLIQRFGRKRKVCCLGFRPEVYDYSPSRLREICFSEIVLAKKYPASHKKKGAILRHYLLKRIPLILLFERRKWSKSKAIIKGLIQGFRGDKLLEISK
ncbi:MAG: hypothetical protein J5886_05210 [Bacteroidales bacterium]|nr:hypothetical protein [Bacteroidales bacterium]